MNTHQIFRLIKEIPRCSLYVMAIILLSFGLLWSTDNGADMGLEANQPLQEITKADSGTCRVIAYYFHGNRRCISCKKIESYTHEAIEQGFKSEIESGQLSWQPTNVDQKENNHFIKDYQLYTKSVIISRRVNDKEVEWKNLQEVWKLLGNEKAFKEYIQDEIRSFLRKR